MAFWQTPLDKLQLTRRQYNDAIKLAEKYIMTASHEHLKQKGIVQKIIGGMKREREDDNEDEQKIKRPKERVENAPKKATSSERPSEPRGINPDVRPSSHERIYRNPSKMTDIVYRKIPNPFQITSNQ